MRGSSKGDTFLETPLHLPVDAWVDNVGAIFVTENQSGSSRTRHMDAQWWCANQLWEEDKLVRVRFTPTAENASNVGMKNVAQDVCKAHKNRLIKEKPE